GVVAEHVLQLGVDQLDAFDIRATGSTMLDGQRALEIVDDQQHLQEEVDDGLVGLIAPFALHTLAVVVELGGLPEEAIVVPVPLGFHRCERHVLGVGRFGAGLGRTRRGVDRGWRVFGWVEDVLVFHVTSWFRAGRATPHARRRQRRLWRANTAFGWVR